METPRFREIIPPLIIFILLASVLGLIFELTLASARRQPVDPAATTVLGGLVGACITALGPLWVVGSKRQPPSEPPDEQPPPFAHPTRVEPTGDPESDDWNRERGWLELREGGRWKPCSTG